MLSWVLTRRPRPGRAVFETLGAVLAHGSLVLAGTEPRLQPLTRWWRARGERISGSEFARAAQARERPSRSGAADRGAAGRGARRGLLELAGTLEAVAPWDDRHPRAGSGLRRPTGVLTGVADRVAEEHAAVPAVGEALPTGAQESGEAGPVDDVVAQDQRGQLPTHMVGADEQSLGEPARRRLLRVAEVDTQDCAVTEEAAKAYGSASDIGY